MKRVEILKKEIILVLLILMEFFIFNTRNLNYIINTRILPIVLFIVPLIGIIYNCIKRKENKLAGRNIFCYFIYLEYFMFIFIYQVTGCMCGHHAINSLALNIYFLLVIFIYIFLINKKGWVKATYIILSTVIMVVLMIATHNDLEALHSIPLSDDEIPTQIQTQDENGNQIQRNIRGFDI